MATPVKGAEDQVPVAAAGGDVILGKMPIQKVNRQEIKTNHEDGRLQGCLQNDQVAIGRRDQAGRNANGPIIKNLPGYNCGEPAIQGANECLDHLQGRPVDREQPPKQGQQVKVAGAQVRQAGANGLAGSQFFCKPGVFVKQ